MRLLLEIILAIAFSFSSNLDNIIIGISYGINKYHIPWYMNGLIAIITSSMTFISMEFGKYIDQLLPGNLANYLGCSALILIGVFMLLKYIIEIKGSSTRSGNEDTITTISLKLIVMTAFALSFNNIATGIAASITGVNILFTTISTFIFSYILLYAGNKIGRGFLSDWCNRFATPVSAIILIILGVLEMLL